MGVSSSLVSLLVGFLILPFLLLQCPSHAFSPPHKFTKAVESSLLLSLGLTERSAFRNDDDKNKGGGTIQSSLSFSLQRRRRVSQQHVQELWVVGPRGSDVDVVLGSTTSRATIRNNTGTGNQDDDDDNDDNQDNNNDVDDDIAEYDEEGKRLQERQVRVQELLQESDAQDREARKRTRWGKYANVSNVADVQAVLEQERAALERQRERMTTLAQHAGVSLTLLEPRDNHHGGGTVYDESGNIQISPGSSRSWFAEMDEDLQDEWEALMEGSSLQQNQKQQLNSKDVAAAAAAASVSAKDVTIESRSGQMVARDAFAGVRVGSAGGWTLEVFPGDFVVHRKYGIGRFERTCLRPKTRLTPEEKQAQQERRAEILTTELRKRSAEKGSVTPDEIQEIRSSFGTEEDTDPISNPQGTVLEISYADAVVHVPVDRAYRLSRYRAGDSVVKPKLSRVKGEAWKKARKKVEESTLQLAQDVLALYATRETLQRQPFDPLVEERVKQFETTFPYEPTPDQSKCFEDVENDMVWRNRPMDRLVCGDVGFGKTEVALRALFRAVANGRQAAMLAPTGVLAAQHFKNIVARMGPGTPFNMEVALLRGGMGKNTKSGREIREQIADGTVQVIVGTHSLLSNDLKFKDLGLLCVDEEQRFGVKQKERLKLICSGIDVLTLSATPIPRTLQMSLSGIRDTSTIRSPPPMRKATITLIQPFAEDVVREAIGRELARGGQCYYVVPRISMIQEAQETIQNIFPHIRIIQAHGRMQRNGAEENVAAFAEGKGDVLLATTVIENGVDIPSVNTIIVQNSQAFGMSTLYQLRGRVGRSDKQAYAVFLHQDESMTEQASMRLQAIGELNELGSGFDVANRDLEIRGAGSLLGTEQSGAAARVGFDLYMRMLKKSIRRLRGLDLPLVPRTNVLFPTDGTPESFYIPEDYIVDTKQRQREEGKARLAESTAHLVNLTNAWKEEYGALPAALQLQLKTLHLHACTRRLGVDLVGLIDSGDEGRMDCVLRSPGLRPRHWATIVSGLPKGAPPKGVDVCFPSRFTLSGEDEEIKGGKKMDLKGLLMDESLSEDQEDEEWDAMDQEEIEAMKDISSAVNVKHMDEVDLEQYPRFVVRNFGSDEKAVDRLLKVLLPIAKVVYEIQEQQAEHARTAVELREKQELLRQRKKTNEKLEAARMGFSY